MLITTPWSNATGAKRRPKRRPASSLHAGERQSWRCRLAIDARRLMYGFVKTVRSGHLEPRVRRRGEQVQVDARPSKRDHPAALTAEGEVFCSAANHCDK
ncbi:MAG TPA: hypothetical protein VFV38_02425 [Ktedonobacteraceae bacterium]|nr:hypothetical protein [Ktedonobacteraceae bacterium]